MINCNETPLPIDPLKNIQLDDSYYYGGQFQATMNHLPNGMICGIITGDVNPNADCKSIINNMLKAFSTKKIGIYAPNVEFTAHITKGKHLWDSLYEVPNTDCTCWFIHPDIVAKLKNIQYHQLSNYGWGIDIIFIEQCKKYNLVAARDYDLMVYQPQYTGYNIEIASIQMKELIDYYNKFY